MPQPELAGQPIQVRFVPAPRDKRGPIHGGSFLRERRIDLDAELKFNPRELSRIWWHELSHFAWLRLGNPLRRSWEELLAGELAARTRGELGWSAEWRKAALHPHDRSVRSRRWREYCCESFCDTAAWMFAGIARHSEFTLSARARARRRRWFTNSGVTKRISI